MSPPRTASLTATGLAICLLAGGCGKPATQADAQSAAASQQAELDRVHAACVEAMVKSTCQVMNGPAASNTATVVFVAGIGPVDAAAYRELRNSGDAMCSVVRQACQADWAGAQCLTARGLWPAPAAPG